MIILKPRYLSGFIFFAALIKFSVAFMEYKLITLEKTRLNNSLVLVSADQASGSGVLIKLKGETKILTNAHVCLADHLYWAVYGYLPEEPMQIKMSSVKETRFYSISTSKLEYNLSEDWCLIPLEKEPFYPTLTTRHLSRQVTPQAINLTYNHKKSSNKGKETFEGCSVRTKKSEEMDRSITNCEVVRPGNDMVLTADENIEFTLKSPYLYNFPTIPGDSGSPTFNEKGKLVGLVSARRPTKKNDKVTLWSVVTPMRSFMAKYQN